MATNHLPYKIQISLITHKFIHHNSTDYQVPLIPSPLTTNNTTRSTNTLTCLLILLEEFLLYTPSISITPTQPILLLSHCQPHTIGTHYLPHLLLYHLLSSSNITLKLTTFLKFSHHKLI